MRPNQPYFWGGVEEKDEGEIPKTQPPEVVESVDKIPHIIKTAKLAKFFEFEWWAECERGEEKTKKNTMKCEIMRLYGQTPSEVIHYSFLHTTVLIVD
jgi:hypothetical protein